MSRNTLLRWFREGRVTPVGRDRHGWRTFSEADLNRIRRELGEYTPAPPDSRMRAYLRSVPLFKHVSDAVLGELAGCARFQGWLRGATLFRPGERTRGLKVLVKGKVRIYRTSLDGREQTLAVVTPFQTLGESALFRAREQHISWATCLESSTVMILPVTRIRQLTLEHPQLATAFLREFSRRIEDLEERLEGLALLNLEQRLAQALLTRRELAQELSLAELASLLGAARESVSRALVRLAKDGLISREGRRIVVLDPEGLARL